MKILTAVLALLSASTAMGGDCSRRLARTATVPQIAQHPDDYQGKCVAIDGVMSAPFLYESVDGVYLQPKDFQNPSSSGFVLGLDNLPRHWRGDYRHVSIVGRVQDCETVRATQEANSDDDGISMIAGYCHTANGPYLWIKSLQYRSGSPFMRQMGPINRKDYGNLAPVPPDWPHRKLIERLSDEFLAALRARNRDALADMHFRNVGLQWKEEEAETLDLLLNDRRSPFAAIRVASEPPQRVILAQRYLVHPDPDSEVEATEAARDYSSIVCFCRTQDCTGRWPIADFDADNRPERPYACTRIDQYLSDKRWVPHFTSKASRYGLAEPRKRPR